MILLQKNPVSFGRIDGSQIEPAILSSMTIEEMGEIRIATDSGIVSLKDIFSISADRSPDEPFVILDGDCETVDKIGSNMKSGSLCVLGNVGDMAGEGMGGGDLIISGNARDRVGAGMSEGMIYILGDCRHGLAAPMPGKKSGMRGGDILVAGSVGDRACERMRRGTVFVAGDAGSYCASQMIAGSVIVIGRFGNEWGGGMRRGSIILGRECSTPSSASLSEPRDFELSYLPLLWKHIERAQHRAFETLSLAIGFSQTATIRTARSAPARFRVPSTRWVQRQIADQNVNGRGEVLVLKRVSSPALSDKRIEKYPNEFNLSD